MAVVTPYTIDLTFPACPVVNSKWWNDYIINGVHACLEFNDTADVTTKGSVTVVGNERIYFNDANSYIGDANPNGVSGLVISDSLRINVSSPSIYIGDGATADIPVVFSGSVDGKIQWQSVETYFQFYDDILMRNAKKLQFRDTALYINSAADTYIDYVADGAHRFAGAVTMDTSLDINSSIAVTGVLDEDTMSSDSNVKLCTQQSIKAYVDSQISGGTYWDRTGTILSTITADDDVTIGNGHLIVDTTTLVVNASGYTNKTGMGTATPDQKLTIYESAIETAVYIHLISDATGSTASDGALFGINASGNLVVNQQETGSIILETAGATAVTIDSSQMLTASGGVTIPTTKNLVMVSDSDILVNTDKFTVAGTTGNTVIAGTLGVTGAVTMDSTLTVSSSATTVTFEDTDSAPSLLLYNSVATPAADTNIGELTFRGKDDGGTASDYAKIAGYVTNDEATNEDGYMVFSTIFEGSLTTAITINPSSAVDFAYDVDIAGDLSTTGAVDIGGNLTIGSGAVGVDYALTFDGETTDGVLTWMEDEDYFQYSDDILMLTTEKLYFRDTAISIHSNADGNLTIAADTRVTIDSDLTFNADGDDLIMGTGGTDTFSVSGGILTLSGSQPFIVDRKLTTTEGRIKNTTRITSADSPYTVLATDHAIFADTDGGAITVNLPAGVDGTEYQICNCGSSGNDVTVDGSTTETINGDLTQTLSDDEAINCIFESTENWRIF